MIGSKVLIILSVGLQIVRCQMWSSICYQRGYPVKFRRQPTYNWYLVGVILQLFALHVPNGAKNGQSFPWILTCTTALQLPPTIRVVARLICGLALRVVRVEGAVKGCEHVELETGNIIMWSQSHGTLSEPVELEIGNNIMWSQSHGTLSTHVKLETGNISMWRQSHGTFSAHKIALIKHRVETTVVQHRYLLQFLVKN